MVERISKKMNESANNKPNELAIVHAWVYFKTSSDNAADAFAELLKAADRCGIEIQCERAELRDDWGGPIDECEGNA